MTPSFVAINDVVLHAERRGQPEKPALVFANSLGTDARIWNAVIPGLLGSFSVLLYDKRGHGLSDAPPGPSSIDDHARDLVALLDHFGIGRCALVGLSVGGMIAQSVAAQHPERIAALVLCDTAAKIGDAATWNARIAAVEEKGLASVADSVLDRWFTPAYRSKEPVALRGWRNMLTRQPVQGYVATCAAIRDADLSAQAHTISVPTLCLVGDQDLSTPPDLVSATADLIPNAKFSIIAGAGHIPCVEQPAALTALIDRHVSSAGFGG